MSFELSIHHFNRNSTLISSIQKYSEISFYPFPRQNRIDIPFKKKKKKKKKEEKKRVKEKLRNIY